ncbi:methyltransferase-domain-containing protein [Flammula alnicola]|nr:methyltransferase-domain-containing protein [Flammula alnicola]
MALFDVPGWTVKAMPVQVSKKRKRPSTSANQLESAEVNVEKLMSKLENVRPGELSEPKLPSTEFNSETKKRKQRQKQKRGQVSAERQKEIKEKTLPPTSLPDVKQNTLPESPIHGNKLRIEPSLKPKKKAKTKHSTDPPQATPSKPISAPGKALASSASGLTALQKSMKDSLDGARFRLINENLYKTDSREAHQMMREDPKVFEEVYVFLFVYAIMLYHNIKQYHTGFRHQVLSWPINPVEHFVSVFGSYPQKTIIVDLGCGDAALAKALLPKGISVLSFDLVSDDKYVVEADICDKIPLPGSEGFGNEKSMGEGQVVDVVVCALSLMGVNWLNCLREAWRILKAGGELHIAEVTSRFTDVEQFQNLLGSIGFRLKSKDESISSHFILFEFTKISRSSKTGKEWVKLLSKGAVLKPCEYKRR